MKQFLSFVNKEFKHILRDGRTLLILLLMPVLLTIFFGYVVTNDVNHIRLAVVDPSRDDITAAIVQEFAANGYFDLVKNLDNVDEVRREFQAGNISIALAFSEHFGQDVLHGGEAAVQLLVDGSEPNQAASFTAYATSVLQNYRQQIAQERGVSAAATFAIVPVSRMLYNPQGKSSYNFVPGVIALILLIICTMITSISIVREKENGSMEVLLASPLPPIVIILAKILPYFIIGFIDLGLIWLLSKFMLGLPMAGNMAYFWGISMLYIFVALALGILISNLVNSQLAAMLISLVLVVPCLYFSDMAFPIDSMAPAFQRVSALMPARWYVSAVRKLLVQGVEVHYVLRELYVLAGMAVVLVSLSLISFRKRL